MNKKIYIISFIFATLLCFLPNQAKAQIALKTNLAHWAIGISPNVEAEMALSKKVTVEAGWGLNLWDFPGNKKVKHWLVQPEARYWFCDVFNGHFVGVHGHVGQLNIGGWDIPLGRLSALKGHRYEGYFYGAGVSYGYQWVVSPLFNIEAGLGGGWARMHYREYDCPVCGSFDHKGVYDYFGITKATLSLIFFIN